MRSGVPEMWMAAVAVAVIGCASSSNPPPEARPDRTQDPEFVAARDSAQPEFETQAEALAAGVYERFVHPDSIGLVPGEPAADGGRADALTTPRDRGDPSTAELLGTLTAEDQYNPEGHRVARGASVVSSSPPSTGVWTLQIGAFGSESGALVRRREFERRYPDLPVRLVAGGDGWIRVYAGGFAERGAAERALERVDADYPDAWITRVP